MADNALRQLGKAGQSVWLDTLSRKLLRSGQLQKLIERDGLSGVTSNPTIFQKAISGSEDYDASLRAYIAKGVTDERELFLRIAAKDVGAAADILKPVYDATGGADGFVSIEVSPDLANNTKATVKEARRIFSALRRKNVMIKVPATAEGLPAIERLTAEGINVNATLLFSVQRYAEVAEAYMRGIQSRLKENLPVGDIASVASFFVSRVDTMVDGMLDRKLEAAESETTANRLTRLFGRAAVANAKLAYRHYEGIKRGAEFRAVARKGARAQRLLWGSTGTKNPAYSDIKYVEELVAPETVNTMPLATMDAYRDHGNARPTIHDGVSECEELFKSLGSLGIDMEKVATKLQEQGVKLFADSFFSLLEEIAEKRDSFD